MNELEFWILWLLAVAGVAAIVQWSCAAVRYAANLCRQAVVNPPASPAPLRRPDIVCYEPFGRSIDPKA